MESIWQQLASDLRTEAQKMHEAREVGLAKCRQLIQLSAKTIRHIHRKQFDEAKVLLEQAKEVARAAQESLKPFGNLYYAGYLHDAEKEMVEAAAVLAMVEGREFPTPSELGCGLMAYLNGMGEASSEMRRYVLDEVRAGRMKVGEDLLAKMESIYEELITFDFSDSMTGGLRRTCDALRAVIERTRSDLTTTAAQQELVRELQATREALGK